MMKAALKLHSKNLLLVIAFVLVISITILLTIFLRKALADDITWSQTDWSGGTSVSLVGNTPNTYLSQTGLEFDSGSTSIYTNPSWDDDFFGWYYRKTFTVNNTSGEELTDVVFEMDINYEVEMNPDFSDIRFSDSSGNVLNYWLEEYSESTDAHVHVKLPTLADGINTFYLYYANDSVESASNGNDTFLYFDDFNDNTWDDEKWYRTHTDRIYEEDGVLKVTNTASSWNTAAWSTQTFDRDDLELSMDYKWVSNNSSYDAIMFTWHDNSTNVSYTGMTYGYYNNGSGTASSIAHMAYELGSNRGTFSQHQWVNGVQYNIRNRLNSDVGSTYQYKQSTESEWQTTYASPNYSTTPLKIGWTIHSGVHYFDNIKVKNWYDTPPTFDAWGDREDYSPLTGSLTSNIFDTTFPSDWSTLTYTVTGGGTYEVKVRSSLNPDMSGASDWTSCNDINSDTDLSDTNCVNDSDRYIQYRINMDMVNGLAPVLEEISFSFSASDQTPPSTNAGNVSWGNGVNDNDWINFEPTITWSNAQDDPQGDGILGYCISLDEVGISEGSQSLDPATTAGVLNGIDDGVNADFCPFIITESNVDFSTIEGLSLNSNHKYYFSIKAVDIAGNIWTGLSEQYQDLRYFRYDDERPENVMYISTPSTNFGSVDDMFFNWPTSGQAQATDQHSGLIGWQYAINSTDSEDWMGTEYESRLGINYIPISGGIDNVDLDSATNGSDIIVGNNTIYFRSIDTSGNVSTYVTGGLNFAGEAPAFPAEAVVTITPESSDTNTFALSWEEASVGQDRVLDSYYYMINTQPPSALSTLTSNSTVYIPSITTAISEDMLIGAVKGENHVYVVAVDDDGNYSPSNAIHGTFTLDSNIPDPPLNLNVSDTSVKSAELWRVAITWEEPEYIGNGDISYIVEKSSDGISWVELDKIKGLAYSDVCSESEEYYYRVASVDTSDESRTSPSYTSNLTMLPEGRFDTPANLVADPEVSEVTTRLATVRWSTDRLSDSKLQYGIASGEYFDAEVYTSTQVTDHILEMNNLLPGTTYYVRAKWTDEDGNTGISDEFRIQTKPAPVVEDVVIDSIGLNYAMLKLTTSGATKAEVIYGKTKTYGANQAINTSTVSSEYSIMLTDLEDGTDYHYKIVLTDEEGYEYESFEDHMFVTPPRPQVSNVQIQEKREVASPTVEVFWESNIETNSIVTYYPIKEPNKVLDKIDMEMVKGEHKMEVTNLLSDTGYQLLVEGVDAMGNKAVSDIYTFTTATDTRPPKIMNIRSEGDVQSRDVQSDRTRSGQLVVSWETDEPSTSQVLYGEGATGDGYPSSTQTDMEMRSKHVVVISNLSPSKVYHFKVVSRDTAGNSGESGSVTAITPKSSDTVIESVLGSLSRIFGFLQ